MHFPCIESRLSHPNSVGIIDEINNWREAPDPWRPGREAPTPGDQAGRLPAGLTAHARCIPADPWKKPYYQQETPGRVGQKRSMLLGNNTLPDNV